MALLAVTVVAMTAPAEARRHKARPQSAARVAYPTNPTDPSKDAALIIDGTNGKVLYARNESELRHPASLTKMMTLYLLFDALKKGQISLNSSIPISAHAAAQNPTKLRVRPGDSINVDLAIKATVVWSANDVAVAIAEALGGTEGHFAEMMTAKARALGMRNTFYHNASGLPDNLQITTANDLAILARHLCYDFPQYYHYFSTPGFSYRGGEYVTHNNLLGHYRGADGIKTGYTGASGFNLVTSVARDNVHVIGVVMGGRTASKRDREMMRLLDVAFNQIGQNPTLVARTQTPWQVAANSTPNPGGANSGTIIALPASPGGDDEDTAERRADAEDVENGGARQAPTVAYNKTPAPQLALNQPKPAQRPLVATVLPQPKPALDQKKPDVVVATQTQHPIPTARPSAPPPVAVAAAQLGKTAPATAVLKPVARPVIIGEGDAGDVGGARTASISHNDWTIQIGAYADLALARSQLAAYAEKAMDVLGQAQRIVVPFQAVDGHTLYRARFGPFAEREARQICARLTERGQTCFAAIATR
ncbi:D-alanyl-D-alanine carboxypeptidase [Rhizomicrobium palustre]|uniref:D-alanyl-D-alanine carboxypeptidase n=1 Tax=Rhizomicrobium palustre TaxID=189966 RepID=A0A846N4W2_9PROT|nr:D-alanyl-D-alanine carboxypeptidase [Rhizomicrobium palustre]NIK90222.1 D-alanyl-D-alanine carboxypeptidase [Rhizomicrobium palustre]